MSSVSAEERNKNLLLERKNRWKQKKAELDAKKKQHVTNNNSSPSSEETLKARQAKLAKWKKLKNSKVKDKHLTLQESTKYSADKRRRVFEESDEEDAIPPPKLYRPDNSTVESPVVSEKKDEGEDPLDKYMASLQKDDIQSGSRVSKVFDNDDDDVDDYFHEQDVNEDHNEDNDYIRVRKLNSKKNVKKVTYSVEHLEPFQKSFYVEPEEIKKMTDDEVNELRLSLDNIKVRGEGCPRPILKWSHLGLTTDIMNLVSKEFKFIAPTPIQAQAMPAIMSGRDVIGISKTGSGKTVSFLLPMLRQIKAQRALSKDETGPVGLILAPTRELAVQIHEEVVKFTDSMIHSICCTGGSELKQQINDLKKGVELAVATPGRFIDLLTLNSGKLMNTKRITFVVMDEADRLFDLGFEPQITEIMKTIRPDKQCVLFSATFPTKLKSFAMRILRNPISITINSKSLINENIEQQVKILGTDDEKFQKMVSILAKRVKTTKDNRLGDVDVDEKTIVFVSSQQICDLIYHKLSDQGFVTHAIHAGKPYNERASSLEKFKSSPNSILICTEVLSRGLNVPEVSLVIIYNAVKTFAQYVHTTGRTARGTNHGTALTLLLQDEFAAAYIINKSLRDPEKLNMNPMDLQALQNMSLNFESGMKTGKYRLAKGFGGKGLDHMEKLNDQKHSEELKNYGLKDQQSVSSIDESNVDTDAGQGQVPKLQYVVLQNKNPDGNVTYSAEVNVNDLPQLVRWEATKNNTLVSIRHETGCSITNRGRFYADGAGPKSKDDEPKLYLLIEAQEEKDVRLAIDLLEGKVREGVKKATVQEAKSGKFSL
ncbi:LAFE_0C06282g1_1 [Lachancea fermentati]|uniref:RNA helicase n=1 Tax=Lachancea fermentati TaxID=4955 RepID=A0A1G4M9I9_LACFM|nr:LAFE_0C06282g1_1 [Lachancea fermentati]